MSVEGPAITTLNLLLALATFWSSQAAWANHPSLDPDLKLSQYVLEVWDARDGLPHEGVQALAQTRDGYLWLGSWMGLVRFDGLAFELFNNSNYPAFSDNAVQMLFVDSLDQLWMVTRGNQLLIYRDGEIEAITTPESFRRIESIFELEDGQVRIHSYLHVWQANVRSPLDLEQLEATETEWVLIPPGETGIAKLLSHEQVSLLAASGIETEQAVIELRESADGRIWAGLADRNRTSTLTMVRWAEDRRSIEWRSSTAGIERVSDVYVDPLGTIWMTGRGLYRYRAGRVSQALVDKFLPGVLSDREGHLWIAELNGLLRRYKNPAILMLSTSGGLPGEDVRALIEADNKSMWVGLRNSGLAIVKGDEISTLDTSDGLVDSIVYSLHQASDGAIWAGGKLGVSRISPSGIEAYPSPHAFPGDEVRAISGNAEGTLWFGSVDGLVERRDGSFELITHLNVTHLGSVEIGFVIALHFDRQGRLWIGTTENGLFVDDGARVQHFPVAEAGTHVRGFFEDEEGTIWFGTRGAGVGRLQNGELRHVRMNDGLYDDGANNIVEDLSGNFWISARRGISRVPKDDIVRFLAGKLDGVGHRSFGRSDGLNSETMTGSSGPTAWRRRNGDIWIGTTEGVAIVQPDRIDEQASPPRVVIQSVHADNRLMKRGEPIPAGTHSLDIRYTSTSLIDGDRNIFRYQLAKIDPEVVQAGTRRQAFYNDLNPGIYEFEVATANAHGIWSDQGGKLQVVVLPFFWQTRWFSGIVIALFVGLCTAAYRWRIKSLNRRREELEEEVRLRTREISEQRNQIRDQADRLRLLDEAKSRFFANVTHEIRTPLTTIIGPLEDWLHTHETPESRQVSGPVKMALQSSKRLYELVNQLMSFARIESGETRLNPRRDDLVSWLERICTRFVPLARNRRLQFELSGPDQDLQVEFDPDQMDFVVSNLISNAFKFTLPGGRVHVELTISPDQQFATITVADTGCGIRAEEQSLVFERFYQSSETHIEGHAGTGIGLSLVKEIAELHHGTIALQSVPDQGSSFVLSLPAQDFIPHRVVPLQSFDFRSDESPEVPSLGTQPSSSAGDKEDRYTVLVIDDNHEVLTYVSQGLAEYYRVLTSESGNRGFRLAVTERPDLIVCDIMMPDGSGLELLRKLRAEPEIEATPVILLTAKAEPGDTLLGLDRGANDYITKPFSMNELKARIRSQIDAQLRLHRQLRINQLEARAQAQAGDEPDIPPSFLEVLQTKIRNRLSESDLTIDDLAEDLHMSRAALYRKLKDSSGAAPRSIIRDLRLVEAKRLLEEGAGNVSEIAYAVGFSSLGYFSRCFRARYEVQPSLLLQRATQPTQ